MARITESEIRDLSDTEKRLLELGSEAKKLVTLLKGSDVKRTSGMLLLSEIEVVVEELESRAHLYTYPTEQ